jgi:serine/threonine-protein kinase HipA
MHLKNFSVIHKSNGKIGLSPAYDLLNLNLIFKDDPDEVALTLNGRKRTLTKNDFDVLGFNLGISGKAVENVYKRFVGSRDKVKSMIERSFLPQDFQLEYLAIWDKKIKLFVSNPK